MLLAKNHVEIVESHHDALVQNNYKFRTGTGTVSTQSNYLTMRSKQEICKRGESLL